MAGDDPIREADKPKVNEGQERGTRDASADWNAAALDRRAAALSPEERAERASVAQPKEGVGCRFGEVPDNPAIKEAIDRLSPEKKALLKNPDATVIVKGRASLVGSAEVNQRLSVQRTEKVVEYLAGREDVKATIIGMGEGFNEALRLGHAAGKDNREDRIVSIDVKLEKQPAPDAGAPAPEGSSAEKEKAKPPTEKPARAVEQPTKAVKEPAEATEKPTQTTERSERAPEQPAKGEKPAEKPADKAQPASDKKEGSEKGKTEIPSRYATGYVMSREEAEKVLRSDRTLLSLLAAVNPFSIAAGTVMQANSADTYQRRMEAATSVDEKLWDISPQAGFLFELKKPKQMEQWKVRNWLREGGYDPDVMFHEYVIHWLRKGVK